MHFGVEKHLVSAPICWVLLLDSPEWLVRQDRSLRGEASFLLRQPHSVLSPNSGAWFLPTSQMRSREPYIFTHFQVI